MTQPPIHHLLFDFDGTLVDSAALHEAAFRTALATGRPDLIEKFDYEAIKGLTTEAAFASLGIAEKALIVSLTADKQQRYRVAVEQGKLTLLDGARELLDWARDSHLGLYLVTGASRRSVDMALTALGLTFDGTITAADAEQGKPAPDGYLTCLARYRLVAKDCLVIEDARSGLEAGRAAGLLVAAVHNPAVRELADLWFPTLRDLQRFLVDQSRGGHVR